MHEDIEILHANCFRLIRVLKSSRIPFCEKERKHLTEALRVYSL